jgi:hypothetical protein
MGRRRANSYNNLKIGRFGKSVLPIKTAFLNLNRFSKIIKKE